jgi:hypothetical protein
MVSCPCVASRSAASTTIYVVCTTPALELVGAEQGRRVAGKREEGRGKREEGRGSWVEVGDADAAADTDDADGLE